jgi:hypothetical protein
LLEAILAVVVVFAGGGIAFFLSVSLLKTTLSGVSNDMFVSDDNWNMSAIFI